MKNKTLMFVNQNKVFRYKKPPLVKSIYKMSNKNDFVIDFLKKNSIINRHIEQNCSNIGQSNESDMKPTLFRFFFSTYFF